MADDHGLHTLIAEFGVAGTTAALTLTHMLYHVTSEGGEAKSGGLSWSVL